MFRFITSSSGCSLEKMPVVWPPQKCLAGLSSVPLSVCILLLQFGFHYAHFIWLFLYFPYFPIKASTGTWSELRISVNFWFYMSRYNHPYPHPHPCNQTTRSLLCSSLVLLKCQWWQSEDAWSWFNDPTESMVTCMRKSIHWLIGCWETQNVLFQLFPWTIVVGMGIWATWIVSYLWLVWA